MTTKQTTMFDQDKPKTITSCGVKVTLRPDVFDDWRVVEMIADMQDGDNASPQLLVRFLRTILGRDQYDRIMRELEEEDGRLPVSRITDFLSELMAGIDPNS